MADTKISGYSELTSMADDDEFVVVDKSDTTMATTGTTKKIKSQYVTIADASTTVKGKVELATDAETITGTDTGRAVTPSNITAKIDTDGTLAGDSDTRIPSQKATKTYSDTILSYIQTGWTPAGETWTYASATTFTVSGDQTDKYTKGAKLKLTNSTTKYFYVVSSSYSSPNTTVTVTGESDLASGSITSPYYSYADVPQGFKRGEDWYKALVSLNSNQSVTSSVTTTVAFDTEEYDVNGNMSSGIYTVPISGYYEVVGSIGVTGGDHVTRALPWLYVDGANVGRGSDMRIVDSTTAQLYTNNISKTVYAEKGDTIDIRAYISCASSPAVLGDDSQTFFSVRFVSV